MCAFFLVHEPQECLLPWRKCFYYFFKGVFVGKFIRSCSCVLDRVPEGYFIIRFSGVYFSVPLSLVLFEKCPQVSLDFCFCVGREVYAKGAVKVQHRVYEAFLCGAYGFFFDGEKVRLMRGLYYESFVAEVEFCHGVFVSFFCQVYKLFFVCQFPHLVVRNRFLCIRAGYTLAEVGAADKGRVGAESERSR